MEQIHAFLKGVSADIDPSKRDSYSWDFPTEGIRILNKDGQGLMVTPLPGNSLLGDSTPTVTFSQGYVVIGACTYNSIIYLVMYNATTGESEIGSYPSISPTSHGLVSYYNPLYNLMAGEQELHADGSGTRLRFRTTRLGFHEGTELDMFAAPSYDNSVNLYICDNENPNLCINSGFTTAGVHNKQTYNDLSFPYGVRLVKATDKFPMPSFSGLTNDGVLMPGNYYLLFRYVTESFDRTSFLNEIGPVSVHTGNTARTIEGMVDETALPTNKAITLTVSSLDTDFAYFEIAVIRYHGPGISHAVRDMYLVHKYYTIEGTSAHVVLTGYEEQEVLTLADIMDYTGVPLICKTHTTAGNRYVGANWKDLTYAKETLAAFASQVYPVLKIHTLEDLDSMDYDFTQQIPVIPQYKDTQHILQVRSHMRGEIYPYAMVFILSNAKMTEAFPIMDCDFANGGYPHAGKGLIRFPDYSDRSYGHVENDLSQALGMEMHLTNAYAYYAAHEALFANVTGFFFVQAERRPNKLYQGWVRTCYNYTQYGNDLYYFGCATSDEHGDAGSSLYFPTADANMPGNTDGRQPCYASEKRYALYSPDYVFSPDVKVNASQTYYIQQIASFEESDKPSFIRHRTKSGDNGTVFESPYLFEVGKTNRQLVTFAPQSYQEGTVYPCHGNTYNCGDQWSTLFKDYNINQTEFAYNMEVYAGTILIDPSIDWANHTIASAPYLGIKLTNPAISLENSFIAVCTYPNTTAYWHSVQNAFTVSDQVYTQVGEMHPFTVQDATVALFSGDCFLNRTFLRATHWYMLPEGAGPNYPHGQALSFISENLCNTQMRCETEATDTAGNTLVYTYYPKSQTHSAYGTLLDWVQLSTSDEAVVEACYINAGYNTVRGGRQYNGYNALLPFVATQYPNRIYLSSRQTPGSFINFYRMFALTGYKDFSWEDGPINSVKELFGKLVTVCDRSINEHFYNESPYRVPTSQGELLLGTTDVLGEQSRKLAAFGSKYTHGIGMVDSAVVGIDTDKDILWRVLPAKGLLDVENLSQQYQVQSWCKENFAVLTGKVLTDTPSWGTGVRIGYDPYYKEIHFTILYHNLGKTLTFSEEINAFLGTAPFAAARYLHDGKTFYSVVAPSGNALNGMYRHNNENAALTFYGRQKEMIFSIMVNGLLTRDFESDPGNTSQMRKVFSSGTMIAGPQPFDRMVVTTPFQHGTLSPFVNTVQFWKSAVYENHMWEYPMPLQDSETENQFQPESDLRGTWARITFYYKSHHFTFIQSIQTHFKVTSI